MHRKFRITAFATVSVVAMTAGLTAAGFSPAGSSRPHVKPPQTFAADAGQFVGEFIRAVYPTEPASSQAGKLVYPDMYLVLGYNKDDEPIQIWRFTEFKLGSDGKFFGVLVTETGKRHPATAYYQDKMYIIDYRPEAEDDPGFGHIYLHLSAKNNRKMVGRAVVFDCACQDGSITDDAAITTVPSMLLTSAALSPEDKKLLLKVDVQTTVPKTSEDELLKH
jgi:hypothetical protein